MRALLSAAVVILAAAVVQAAGPAGGRDSSARQTTVVALRLTISARTATVKVVNKGCGSVTVEGQPTVRLSVDAVGDQVDLATWEVTDDSESCSPPATATRNKLVAKGSTDVAIGEAKFQVELLAVSTITVTPSGQGPCSSCCVACAGTLICGCEVEAPCGRCCCPDACGCQPSGFVEGMR